MEKENPSNYGKLGMKEILDDNRNEEWYCPNCGTAQKDNTVVNKKAGDRILTCADCNIVIRFYVISPATKTAPEAAKSFDATPLTKNQQFGSGNKPFKGRKRKRKMKKK